MHLKIEILNYYIMYFNGSKTKNNEKKSILTWLRRAIQIVSNL